MTDYDWQNQSRLVEGISSMGNMGKGNCVFRKKAYLDGEEITHICTLLIDQYDNIPHGCGWNYGQKCWIDAHERKKKNSEIGIED